MLLVERPHDLAAPGWQYEIKHDGYRLLAQAHAGQVELRSKNGADATRWFPELVRGLSTLPGGPHVIDGEVCILDDIGRSNFDRLQDRARRRGWYAGAEPVTYCAFDLLVHDGVDIMGEPLEVRQAALAELLTPAPGQVLLVQAFELGTDMKAAFTQFVVGLQLEGLVAKRLGSVYRPGVRSPDWIKVKRKGAVPAQRFKRPGRTGP